MTYDIWLKDNQNCLMKRLISVDRNQSEMLITQLALCDDFSVLKLSVENVTVKKILPLKKETNIVENIANKQPKHDVVLASLLLTLNKFKF